MELCRTVDELKQHISHQKKHHRQIGFVPTMGALHNGHISLLNCANQRKLYSVVSIFVNPTQFNNADDLKKYPRTEQADFQMLEQHHCNCVFAPTVEEIYPPEKNFGVELEFGIVDKIMEGKHRPGHFAGVASVVKRLFDIVTPDVSFFGQKDFQQLAVIQLLNKQIYNNRLEIVPCAIVREPDGLAMSSRNVRLSSQMRMQAPLIYQTLHEAAQKKPMHDVQHLKKWVVQTIEQHSDLKVEYFDIVDALTLVSITHWNVTNKAVGCIAVHAGDVRLIDNINF